jgi:large subunit ribosomal protein L23
MMRTIYDVIKRPLISEKSAALAELGGKYSFEVIREANKNEIRDAVQKIFNVKVREVRTLILHGKTKRVGRFEVKRPNWKKAIVTLAAGQKIEFHQSK